MNILVFFGVVLVIAYVQANTENLTPFFEDFMISTNDSIRWNENPSNFEILSAKINALDSTIPLYDVSKKVYQSVFSIFNEISQMQVITSDYVLNDLYNKQDDIDAIFDELISKKDMKGLSKINDLINDFFSKYVALSVELFDSIIIKTKNLEENADELFKELSKLVDIFAENIGKCLVIPKTEFKEVFQCRQNARNVLPNLTTYYKKLDNLDGMESLNELLSEIRDGKIRLDRRINELQG